MRFTIKQNPPDDDLLCEIYWKNFLLRFIEKHIPGASQEFICNVSPSTIIHVNQLHHKLNLEPFLEEEESFQEEAMWREKTLQKKKN